MKTRTISNQYGSVVIIDDVKEAEKVLSELKTAAAEKAAVDAAIARKAVARRRKAAKAFVVPEERISGVKANRAARRAERRTSKKKAKRVTNALKLYEEAVTEELHVHDVQVPSVYQKNVPAGHGVCSDLQKQFCVQLYGSEKDALFRVPGTKVTFWKDFWGNLQVRSDNRVWATKIRISELEDTPDFVLLDDGLHVWNDLSHCTHEGLHRVTEYNVRNFFLDAVCFTTIDGSEVKVLFYSETLHTIAKLQAYLVDGPVNVYFNGISRMITSTEDIHWLMVNAKSVSIYCSYDCNEVGELAGQVTYNVELNDGVTLPFPAHDEEFEDMIPYELMAQIQPYSYKPEPIFYGSGLFFGQEFEFEFKTFRDLGEFLQDLSHLSRFVYFKRDGSLTGPSVEVVTHPCAYEVAVSLCRDITTVAISHNAMTTNCGHHVHISRNFFSEKEVSDMVKTVHKFWTDILIMSGRHSEEAERFCADSFNNDVGRYAAVNVMNTNTVEIRVMKAKANVDKAVDNLTFTKLLGDSVKNKISWLPFWVKARSREAKRHTF